MPPIDPGQRAPAFTLPDQNCQSHRLSQHKGKAVVLFFYPKDDTSGCTQEACDFRDDYSKFKRADAVVLGISPQNVRSKAKFATKIGLNYPILADEPGDDGIPPICARYGVWVEKSMYGRKYMGVQRTTYLIKPSGTIARRWDKVKIPGHVDEVLAAVKSLERVTAPRLAATTRTPAAPAPPSGAGVRR
ncbi:MAG: peroxiredoxin [Phycisphaeraceae bacterium]|nr:peroxiredoxin [Phycisphaeraceae bacterium]MCB9846993.1 peroxiredoxin [Phycisphaeraceae bacterium]